MNLIKKTFLILFLVVVFFVSAVIFLQSNSEEAWASEVEVTLNVVFPYTEKKVFSETHQIVITEPEPERKYRKYVCDERNGLGCDPKDNTCDGKYRIVAYADPSPMCVVNERAFWAWPPGSCQLVEHACRFIDYVEPEPEPNPEPKWRFRRPEKASSVFCRIADFAYIGNCIGGVVYLSAEEFTPYCKRYVRVGLICVREKYYYLFDDLVPDGKKKWHKCPIERAGHGCRGKVTCLGQEQSDPHCRTFRRRDTWAQCEEVTFNCRFIGFKPIIVDPDPDPRIRIRERIPWFDPYFDCVRDCPPDRLLCLPAEGEPPTLNHLLCTFKNVINWAIDLAPILGVIMITIAGLMFMFSTGIPEKILKAKNALLAVGIGLIIIFGARAFIEWFVEFFRQIGQ